MEKLKKLLQDVNVILQKEKVRKEESRKRGELFNVFEVLGLQTSEVRLHSAFIAELLNPKGSHGLGDKFLKAFIEQIVLNIKSINFDLANIQVIPEFNIGPISENYQEGGRIDILVQDDNNHIIIIENKIYAGDQPLQLLRYHNYAEKNRKLSQECYILLYLTLHDGILPNEDSIGCNQFEYYCISYHTHILNWLEKCLELASRYPLIRETIQQYIINLKNILSIMGNKEMDEYLELLTSKENVSTTLGILEKSWSIQCKIRTVFVRKIQALCNEMGLQCEYDEGIVNCEKDTWIRIWDKCYEDVCFRVGVVSHTNADGYRMDFFIPSSKKVKDDFNYIFWPEGKTKNQNNPVGWDYLWSASGEPNSGKWWRWDDLGTLQDMTNGKMKDFIRNTLCLIKEQNCFRIISDALLNNPQ